MDPEVVRGEGAQNLASLVTQMILQWDHLWRNQELTFLPVQKKVQTPQTLLVRLWQWLVYPEWHLQHLVLASSLTLIHQICLTLGTSTQQPHRVTRVSAFTEEGWGDEDQGDGANQRKG